MCAERNPREEIHRHLKNAGEHVRQAGKIARDVGDKDGDDDFSRLGEQIQTRTDKFDKKKGM